MYEVFWGMEISPHLLMKEFLIFFNIAFFFI